MTVATRKTFDFCTARDLPARAVATGARAAVADVAAVAALHAAARSLVANRAARLELVAREDAIFLPVSFPLLLAPERPGRGLNKPGLPKALLAVHTDPVSSSGPPFHFFLLRGLGTWRPALSLFCGRHGVRSLLWGRRIALCLLWGRCIALCFL